MPREVSEAEDTKVKLHNKYHYKVFVNGVNDGMSAEGMTKNVL